MKNLILFLGFFAISFGIFAQVGINTTAPDSSAVLDLKANNKGLLIPTMTTTQREAMQATPPATGLADGLLVYDTDYKRFYFWDSSVSKWVVLNNWRKEYTSNTADDEHVYINLENNSNVGINQPSPNSKLTVNGNISVGNTNTTAPANGTYVDGQVRIGSSAGNTAKLEVGGNATITGTTTSNEFVGKGVTPVGGIIMYSGSTVGFFDVTGLGVTSTKMNGWAICNGNNGTPDLRGEFIVGATMGEAINNGDYVYAATETGGENTHQLTIAEMPKHNHNIDHTHSITDPGHSHSYRRDISTNGSHPDGLKYGDTDDNSHNTNVSYTGITINYFYGNSGDTGGDQPHENRPPYYAVYYIMRIN